MKDGFCSMGLLQVATKTGSVTACAEETKVLADIIREQFPERICCPDHSDGQIVANFNDHTDTTFADVERVFEKAEVAWDERV